MVEERSSTRLSVAEGGPENAATAAVVPESAADAVVVVISSQRSLDRIFCNKTENSLDDANLDYVAAFQPLNHALSMHHSSRKNSDPSFSRLSQL